MDCNSSTPIIPVSFDTATRANTYMPSYPQTPNTNRRFNFPCTPGEWSPPPTLQSLNGQASYPQPVPVTGTTDVLDERLNSPKADFRRAYGLSFPYTPESQIENAPPAIIQVYQGDIGVLTPPLSELKAPMMRQQNLVEPPPFPNFNKGLNASSSHYLRNCNPDDVWKQIPLTPQRIPSNPNDHLSVSQPISSRIAQSPVSCQDLESTPAHDETASRLLGSPSGNQPSSTQKPPHQDITRKGRKRDPAQNISSSSSHPTFRIEKPLQYVE